MEKPNPKNSSSINDLIDKLSSPHHKTRISAQKKLLKIRNKDDLNEIFATLSHSNEFFKINYLINGESDSSLINLILSKSSNLV